MIVSGCTYQQVADRLGYQNRGTVHRLVQPLLRATRPKTLDEAFELHVARLDSLLEAHFGRALERDRDATKTVLEVLRQMTSLLGLVADDATAPRSDPSDVIDPAELVRRARDRE